MRSVYETAEGACYLVVLVLPLVLSLIVGQCLALCCREYREEVPITQRHLDFPSTVEVSMVPVRLVSQI